MKSMSLAVLLAACLLPAEVFAQSYCDDPVIGKATRERVSRAAEAGSAHAMHMLGLAYWYGQDCFPQDNRQARKWFQKAAGKGNATSKSMLAQMDERARPKPAVVATTAPSAPSAPVATPHGAPAAAGDGAALYQQASKLLDDAYTTAVNLPRVAGDSILDRERRELDAYRSGAARAVPLLRQAMAAGNRDAMERLRQGYCKWPVIAREDFVPQDKAQCRELSTRLAAEGVAGAMLDMGRLAKEEGPSRDLNAAKEWFEKAAAKGNVIAHRELGLLHLPPRNWLPDAEKSRQWLALAARLGDEYSASMLQRWFPQKPVLTAAQQDFIALIESVGPDASEPHKYSYDAEVYCRLGGARCNEFRGKAVRFYEAWNARAEQANMERIRNLYRTSPAEAAKFDARTKCLQQRSESIRRATYGQQDWYYDTKC